MPILTRVENIGKSGNPPWAIDGVVSGLTILWGGAGVGKSFVAMSMAASVASGRPWMGRETRHGQVVYLAGEGGLINVGHRLRTALAQWGINTPDDVDNDYFDNCVDLSVITPAIDLVSDSVFLDRLINGHTSLNLLVVDTLSRCLTGDENKQEDMSKFVSALDRIRDKHGCDIIVIHHANKSDALRGSSVLFGAADVSWRLNRLMNGDQTHQMVAEKLRERDSMNVSIVLRQDPVPMVNAVGGPVYDTVGDVQTTLVCKPTEAVLEQVQAVAAAGKAGLRLKSVMPYAQWRAGSSLSKGMFDNALSYILSYPGRWGIARGEGVGTYVKADANEPDYRWV